jgi:hypothetical protein
MYSRPTTVWTCGCYCGEHQLTNPRHSRGTITPTRRLWRSLRQKRTSLRAITAYRIETLQLVAMARLIDLCWLHHNDFR